MAQKLEEQPWYKDEENGELLVPISHPMKWITTHCHASRQQHPFPLPYH
jgi:hypothetical protein